MTIQESVNTLTHNLRDAQKDTHDIHREPRMRKQRVESYAQTLATVNHAKRIESDDEKSLRVALEGAGQDS